MTLVLKGMDMPFEVTEIADQKGVVHSPNAVPEDKNGNDVCFSPKKSESFVKTML